MPPKGKKPRGKYRQGQDSDQPSQASLPQSQEVDRPQYSQLEDTGRFRDLPQTGDAEGYKEQQQHFQPRGAEGNRGSQQYPQQRGPGGNRGPQQHFQPRDTEGNRGPQQHPQQSGIQEYRESQQYPQQRGPEGNRGAQQHFQPRDPEGNRGPQQRGFQEYRGSQQQIGTQEYREPQQNPQQKGPGGNRGPQQHFQPRDHEGNRGPQQYPQASGTQGNRGPQQHFQTKGAEGFREQPQHISPRDTEEYRGSQKQFPQREEPNRERGQDTWKQHTQQSQPKSFGAWEEQTKQGHETLMQGDRDSFKRQSQKGPPELQQSQPRDPEHFRQQPPSSAKAWGVQPQQGQSKRSDTSMLQQTESQVKGKDTMQQGSKQGQPRDQEAVKKTESEISVPFQVPISLQKSEKDAIEQLLPELSSLSLESSGAVVKLPTVDTPKGKSESVPTTSSATLIESTTVKPSPKKSLLNLNIKINPTLQQLFLPKRPDPGGKKGRDIQLIINCLDMKVNPKMKIFMYDIELTKAEVTVLNKKRDVKVKTQKKECLREIVYEFLKDKGGVPVFDGGKIIFTNKMLPIKSGVNKIEFKHTLDGEIVTCYFDLQHVKEEAIELGELTHYIESGKGRSDNLPQEALRALDTIMKEMFLNKNLISVNRRAIFDPKTSKPLRCGPYLLLDGFATTVRPHMWKIRFNFDKTQIVIHKPMNLYEYISELTGQFRNFRPDNIKKKIHLLRVEATHLKNAEGKSYTRKYTIHGFSRGTAKTEMIVEKKISIEQYFLNEYKIKLKYPQYELIKTHPTNKTYVPMELLTVLPHQKVLANDAAIVQEVIRAAAVPAFDRLQRLKEAIKTLNFGDQANKFIKNYMIEIDDKLINVNGRVLDGPEAKFGAQRPEYLRGGKWDFRGKTFYQPHPDKVNWALFAVGTERDYQRDEQVLFTIEDQLPGSAGRVGVKMEPSYHFQYIPWQKIEIEVPNVITKSEQDKKRLDLLVFVINRDDDYKAVKRFGDMTFGIATQCMKLATLTKQKAMDQYFANIMLKINTKLGGINWELLALVNKNFSPIKGRFMVFGIDVTHPGSTRNDLSKSIAAMVGSLDNTASLYSAVIRQQLSKEDRSIIEIVLDFEEMVHKLLMNFYRANKTLKPDHLLFYRDGVSEGQFDIVFKHEIIAVQNACSRLEAGYQPKITYIVVQKRHKIRFFPSNPKDAIGRSGNVPAGTVVDKDITHCREFDFYLCSHEGIQGTSKPAHYHVLFDENNWGSDDLQSFTYFLCHVYARSTRSVSYPAPTYYAHLAAFRGRALIGETFDDSSSSASGQTQKVTDLKDAEIVIHDYHNNKLFFI